LKIFKVNINKIEVTMCIILMIAITVVTFIQVIMRYVMHNSLSWSEELARYLFIWLTYVGVSYGSKEMKHVKIEAALTLFPNKVRPYIVILGDLLFLAFSIFVVYTSYEVVLKQLEFKQKSPAIEMPIWIIYAAPMVGFAFTTIRQIQTISYRFKKLRTGGELNG
jgi:TRAP-type C4-dicarboxylate transport system permease small subunit